MSNTTFRSQTVKATNGASVELATMTHEGREFTNHGAIIDEERGFIVGYVKGTPTGEKAIPWRPCAPSRAPYTLITWNGTPIAPLTRTGAYRNNLGARIECFRMVYKGRTYSGRKGADWTDLLRMRCTARKG